MLRRKRYLLIPPATLLVALAAVLIWGWRQPRPAGFAPGMAVIAAPAPAGQSALYTVDARSADEWVFFDFARGAVIDATFEADGWDIALRRTQLRTNGGVTNPRGNVAVANLGAVPLDPAAVPAHPVLATDQLGGEDGDEVVNEAIPKWYRYNFISHVVSARDAVYMIRSGARQDAIVQFESYYCADGAPGCVTFRYLLVPRAAAVGVP